MAASTAAVLVLILTVGGFIFYNTNVLNAYQTALDVAGRRAEYERRYGQYRAVAQPQVAGVHLNVEIFSARRLVEVRGTFDLGNQRHMRASVNRSTCRCTGCAPDISASQSRCRRDRHGRESTRIIS